jgi:hypothetical protein
MNDVIIRTPWFENAFPDVSAALDAGSTSPFEAMKMMDERLRARLYADMKRRGLSSCLPMAGDIYQQFWILLLEGKLVENFDPEKASPWPMIYQNMRWATWKVSMDQNRVRSHISYDLCDLAAATREPFHDFDNSDLYAAICGYAEKELTAAKLAALKAKYAMPDTPSTRKLIAVENQRVDRHRALNELKARFENSR